MLTSWKYLKTMIDGFVLQVMRQTRHPVALKMLSAKSQPNETVSKQPLTPVLMDILLLVFVLLFAEVDNTNLMRKRE